jgi:hypothetical protein
VDRGQKPLRQCSRAVLETITVKLFQDENAPGPKLKPDEKYVGSLINKYGDVISHNYRRRRYPQMIHHHSRASRFGGYVCQPKRRTRKRGQLTPHRFGPRKSSYS